MRLNMRHIAVVLLFLVAALRLNARPPMGIAATYNFATEYQQHGIGAKLCLDIYGPWRLEPEIIYFAQNKDVTTLQLNANVHYVMPMTSRIYLYPFAGISYSHWGYVGPDKSRWGANLGGGAEFYLGRGWSLIGEYRFMLVKQETQAIPTFGIKRLF